MRSKEQQELFRLPNRPSNKSYRAKGRTVDLLTNHFKVTLENIEKIYIYHLKISPRIEQDNRQKKNQIMESIREVAQKQIGLYIVTGFSVFSSSKPGDFNKSVEFDATVEGEHYIVNLTLARTNYLKDLKSDDKIKQEMCLRFFNVLIKFFLKQMKYSEFGKDTKYYDMSNKIDVQGTDLVIYGGFETSMNMYEKDLFLRVEVSHKVVRKDNILNMINQIYNNNAHRSKEEKRNLVTKLVQHKIVLANYGNHRYWTVKDVLFDTDSSTFIIDGTESNIIDYYKLRYGLIINVKRQPLLKVEIGKDKETKKKQYGYLVPEFCMLTGLPNNFNEFQRRKLAQTCMKTVKEKVRIFEDLAYKIVEENKNGNICGKEIASQTGITINDKLHELKGMQLEAPLLKFGGKEEIEGQRAGNWQFKGSFYDTPKKSVKWCIIHFRDFQHNGFIKTFYNLTRQFNFEMDEPKRYDMGYPDRRAVEEIEYLIENRVDKVFDIALIIIPNNLRDSYQTIKRFTTIKRKVITQFCFEQTLDKKFNSVCGKLMQQMAAKCGSILWVSEPKCGFPPKTIMIGATVTKDKQRRNKSIVAIVSTRNDKFSKFYSRVIYQQKGTDTIENIQQLIKECITAYYKTTSYIPDQVIYLREGLSTQSLGAFQQLELSSILKAFTSISEKYSPKMAAILVNKRVGQKFYQTDYNDNLSNPPFGTIINKEICSPNYDFYLIAQQANQGACTPTHYNVVYDTTDMSEGQLQEILFSQCFNYMNWNGAIRVPAPLQYATKLSQFISMHVNDETHQDLRKTLYFL